MKYLRSFRCWIAVCLLCVYPKLALAQVELPESSPVKQPLEFSETLDDQAISSKDASATQDERSNLIMAEKPEEPVNDGNSSADLKVTYTSLSSSEIKRSLDRGRNAYLYGSYEEAVKNLTPLIKPKVQIAEPKSLSQAYEYLGLAHFYLGNEAIAVEFFKDLIYFRPEHQLDPVRVPPNAVSLYNQLRDELQTELQLRQEAMTRQSELEEEKRLRKLRQAVILEQQINQRLVAFLPFGAGQFQNKEQGLGYFFLGSEIVAVALSAGFFWGVESLRQPDGRFTSQDYLFAQELQRAQIISGGVALGLMVSGILQALWRYKDRHDLGNYLDLNQEDKDDSFPNNELSESDSLDDEDN